MTESFFRFKKATAEKLLKFGFVHKNGLYEYTADIADNQLQMVVTVFDDGTVDTKVEDKLDGEEYVLHKNTAAEGSFVGTVKSNYEALLAEIAEKCFEPDVFKSPQSREIINYVRKKYGDKPEFLWKKFQGNAVLRRKDTAKWYAVLLTVSKRKLGIDSDEIVEIIDLRIKPENMPDLIDGSKYFPGWHMNKKSWYTIILDGSVSTEEIQKRTDESYKLADK